MERNYKKFKTKDNQPKRQLKKGFIKILMSKN